MAGELFQGLTIRIGADTKKLQASLGQVEKKAAAAQKTLRKLNTALKLDSSRVSAVDERLSASGDAAQLAAAKARKLQRALEDTGKAATAADPSKTFSQLAAETQDAFTRAQRLTDEYNQLDETIRLVKQDIASANGLSLAEAQAMDEKELDAYIERLRQSNSLTDAQSSKLAELKERWKQVAAQQQDALTLTRMESARAEIEKQRAQVTRLSNAWEVEGEASRKAAADSGIAEMSAQATRLNARIEETTAQMRELEKRAGTLSGATSETRAKFLQLSDVLGAQVGQLRRLQSSVTGLKSQLGGVDGTTLVDLREATQRAGDAATSARAGYALLEGELTELKERAAELRSRFDRLQAAGEDTSSVTAEMRKLDARIEQASDSLVEMREKAKAADESFSDARLRTEVKRVETEVEKANTKLATFSGTLSRIEKKSLASTAYNIRSVGTALSATSTMVLSMGLYEMVDAADEIDAAYRDMRKTVDATEEEFEALKDTAVEFSQTHVTDAATVLEIEALGGQLGIAADSLDEFATVISNLDVATDIDAEDAAESLGKLANITGMTEDDYTRFGDSLVRMGNNFAAMESDIVNITTRFAGQGSIVGMATDEMLGWATAASATGMKAEAAGSSMNRTIGRIEKAVAKGGDTLEKYAEVSGMSAEEFAAAWESSPSEAMQAFVEGLAGIDASGGSVTTTLDELGITGVRDVQLLSGLAQSTDTLSDALEQSADAWETGGDAEEEAQKKAEGFSGQLSILKNNAQVLASDMGETLAPALGTVSDVVLTLTENWEAMSEGQQQSVLKAIALVAALGPVMTLGGALGQTVGRVADGFSDTAVAMLKTKSKAERASLGLLGVNDAAGLAAASTGTLGGNAKEGAKQLQRQATKAKLCSGAITALKGAAVVAGVAIAAYFAAKIAETVEEEEEFEEALERTDEACSTTRSSINRTADSLDDSKVSIDDAKSAWEDFRDAQDEAVESLEASAEEYEGTCEELNGAKEAIDDYMGVTGLSTVEQGKLTAAIETVNDACGTEYEVIDAANGVVGKSGEDAETAAGKLDKYKDKIHEVIDATKEEARTSALTEQLNTLYSEQADAVETVAELEQALADARHDSDSSLGDIADSGYYDVLDDLNDAKAALENVNDNIESTALLLGQTEEEADGASKKVQRLQELLGGSDSSAYMTFESILSARGYTVQDFADALKDAGYKVSDLSELTEEELTSMATSFDDGADTIETSLYSIVSEGDADMTELMKSLSDAGLSFEEISALGSDNLSALSKACDGDVGDMMTVLSQFDMTELSDKTFTVSSGGTLTVEGYKLSELNSVELRDKGFEVSTDGTVKIAQDELAELCGDIDEVPDEKTVTVGAEKSSAFDKVISSVKKAIKSITGNVNLSFVSAGSGAGNASGGYAIPQHAAGGYAIPEWGSGAIFTSATLTRHGYVGEAGAEAIVPLENRKYAQPFIDMLSEGLAKQGGQSTVNNYTLGNVTYTPDAQVVRLLDELMTRVGMIERGRGA